MNLFKKSLLAVVLSIASAFAFAGPVNINTADAATLASELKGIGPRKADDIIAYRDQFGPFVAKEQLLEVKGVGAKTLEQNSQFILLSDESAAE